MLETYAVVLTDSYRHLLSNIRSSPILYIWFGFMLMFSIGTLGVLTLFFLRSEVFINIDDVFFAVFFLLVMKAGYDFHRYFIKASSLSYALSCPVSHRKTVFEVFLVVFWIQLGMWVLFSSLYHVVLVTGGVTLGYPLIYLRFTVGVMLASIVGVLITMHYFSAKRYKLIPIGILLGVLWYVRDFSVLIVITVCCLVYLVWSLRDVLSSYLFVPRKERKKEGTFVKLSLIHI